MGKDMSYSWSAYYRDAYERERKRNVILAGKVADAEAKKAEFQEKYRKISGHPLYRVLLPFVKVKHACGAIGRGFGKRMRAAEKFAKRRAEGELFPERNADRTQESIAGKQTAEAMRESYQKRLKYFAEPYAQWLKEKEPSLWEKAGLEATRRQDAAKCAVIAYEKFANITSVTELVPERHGEKAPQAKPDILLFAERPEDLDERAVSYIQSVFCIFPAIKLLYGQEDRRESKTGRRSFPWQKPCWSPDTLLGFFYFGSYFALRRSWAEKVPLKGLKDAKENLYDYVLRLLAPYYTGASEGAGPRQGQDLSNRYLLNIYSEEIVCSELILYHRSCGEVSEIPVDREYFLHTGEMLPGEHPEFWGFEKKYIKLKQDFIKKLSFDSFAYQSAFPEVWTAIPEYESAAGIVTKTQPEAPSDAGEMPEAQGTSLSVIIPSKDHPALLKKCIGSFMERTAFPFAGKEKLEFIVVDNGSSEENRKETENFLASCKAKYRYLYRPMPFHFSLMCNLGVEAAKGDYILLLNDDMEIIEENWLKILLGQALLPGTGAVGAKLLYPQEDKIQHVGVTNMHIGPSHKLTTFPDDRVYYYGHNTLPYDAAGVTAACLLVRKSLYQKVGGLDEEMAVSYNDVDFCFKMAEAGYRNVVRNDAVLLHHESASRGNDELSDEKWDRLLEEKEKLYKKHPLFYEWEPYYSDYLIDNASDYRIGYQYPYERRLVTETPKRREGKADLQALASDAAKIGIERAGMQRKLYPQEADICEIVGWSYILHEDNALYERTLILEAAQGDFYYCLPVKECRRTDVAAVFSEEKNIELSGFTCRILKEDLISGEYTVGMFYENVWNGKLYYQRSDKRIGI